MKITLYTKKSLCQSLKLHKIKKRKKIIMKPVLCNRNSTITQLLVGFKTKIYNGKRYKSIVIRQNMLNHKLGEFIITKVMGSEIAAKKRAKQKKLLLLKRKKNK